MRAYKIRHIYKAHKAATRSPVKECNRYRSANYPG